jgi:hypothetical protein
MRLLEDLEFIVSQGEVGTEVCSGGWFVKSFLFLF